MLFRDAINANELGLSALHINILNIVQASEQNRCTANKIAQVMKRDKAQIARLIKELLALNLIIKLPNPDDKRSQLLVLTDEGCILMNKISHTEKMVQQKLEQGISSEDLATFNRVAKIMINNLS